ncbi:hypothetical protein BKA57DRAFT_535269 [Linnemannia elongata]|nr:hypothetical protein BKA57DRAFT_535269 [Linnemannia elongata]
MSRKSHNNILSGTPRLIDREDDLYLSDPETTTVSYEPPIVLPPTIQDHHDAVQVQLDAAQALTRVLVVAAIMIAVAALVVVTALQGHVNDLILPHTSKPDRPSPLPMERTKQSTRSSSTTSTTTTLLLPSFPALFGPTTTIPNCRELNTRPMIEQLMGTRRYSHQKDILGRTRILFMMAFGERVPEIVTLPERAPAVPAGPSPEQRLAAPYLGKVAHPSDAVVPMTIRHVTGKLKSTWSSCFFGSQDVSETISMTFSQLTVTLSNYLLHLILQAW